MLFFMVNKGTVGGVWCSPTTKAISMVGSDDVELTDETSSEKRFVICGFEWQAGTHMIGHMHTLLHDTNAKKESPEQ
jgi:hypothetical protein